MTTHAIPTDELMWNYFMKRVTAYGFETVYDQSYKYHVAPCTSLDACSLPAMIVAVHPAKKLLLHALSIVYCATDGRPEYVAVGKASVYGTGRMREDALCGEKAHFERCDKTWPSVVQSYRFFRIGVLSGFTNLCQLEKRVEFVNWLDSNPPISLQNYAEINTYGDDLWSMRARKRWQDFCINTLGPAGAFASPALV